MSKCKAAIKHLDYLHIIFSTGWGYESRLTARAELGECKEYLSKGDLVELASAAKDLRTLDIAFDGKFPQPCHPEICCRERRLGTPPDREL